MEIKEIALKLCNLPEGEYFEKTKLGDMLITCIRMPHRSDFRVVNVDINGEKYTEIVYSNFDYFHLWEKIYLKNNDQKYVLEHEINEGKNQIQYITEDGNLFVIKGNVIYNYNNNVKCGPTYEFKNDIFSKMVTSSENTIFSYNIDNNQKSAYIKKNNNNEYIEVKGDIYSFISKYNELVDKINTNTKRWIKNQDELNNHTDKYNELLEAYLIPHINLEKAKKTEEEFDKYLEIYKEYAPKLQKHHSPEMLETLEEVATTLEEKYNSKEDNNKKETSNKKIFNLSKFKK